MYCEKCGKAIPDQSAFCPECGATQGTEFQGAAKAREKSAASKKNIRIALAAIGGLLILLVLIGAASAMITPTINLNKYMDVKIEGYDGYGTVKYYFDEEKLARDYGRRLEKKSSRSRKTNDVVGKIATYFTTFFGKSEDKDEEELSAARSFISQCVGGSFDQTSGLSNGDEVIYTWSCNDSTAKKTFGVHIRYKDIKTTVKKLDTAETFDAFDGISLTYDGIGPNGSAYVSGNENNAYPGLGYRVENNGYLSNGDTVTVTLYVDESYSYGDYSDDYYEDDYYFDDTEAEEEDYEDDYIDASSDYDMGDADGTDSVIDYCVEAFGMIPEATEKTFTVDGLQNYITSYSEISSDALDAMTEIAESGFNDYNSDWDSESEALQSFTPIGAYVAVAVDPVNPQGSVNYVYMVYQVQVHNWYSNDDGSYNQVNTFYWCELFYNLINDADGVTQQNFDEQYNPVCDYVEFDSGLDAGWYNFRWDYYGLESLETLQSDYVNFDADYYQVENAIDESLAPEVEEIPQPETTEEDEETEGDGSIFPNSSDEMISEEDIQSLSDEDLRYAINEIYARHGYIFTDEALNEYFGQFDWYSPETDDVAAVTAEFNDIETDNLELMQSERDGRN